VIGLVSESIADTLASASQYAAHQLGGITRKVEIYAVPQTFISRLHLATNLDERFVNANLIVDLDIRYPTGNSHPVDSIRVALVPLDGNPSDPLIRSFPLDINDPSGSIHRQLRIPVANPHKWDPEHPFLYKVEVSLTRKGSPLEVVGKTAGFREILVAGNRVFVNGRPIKLLGVNRHEVHPTRGRSLTMKEWSADVLLFKKANVNYIRTSHYPPAEEFIELCDSAGLFVECESPLCWVGHGANAHWQKADPHDPALLPLIRQEVLETVAQYRDHPSVIIWSMANESVWGPNWAKVLREVNRIDPTRPVSFHDQAYGDYNNAGSTACQIAVYHYPGPSGPRMAGRFDRPLLFGEYAHLNCYNRQEIVTDPGVRDDWGRGLEPMVEDMINSPGCLGGAIWSGIDDAFFLPSGRLVGYGEWGPIDGWRRPKPEYWHIRKAYSPVRISVRRINLPAPGKPIRIPVENRYLFSNLVEVNFLWKLGGRKGVATAHAEPGETGLLTFYPIDPPASGDVLEINVFGPQKFLVDSYRITVGEPAQPFLLPAPAITPQLVNESGGLALVSGKRKWLVDRQSGRITGVSANGSTLAVEGPDLQMLSLTTGPCQTEHSLNIEPLNDLCHDGRLKVAGLGTDEKGPWIRVEGSYDEADISLTYRMDSIGELHLDYRLTCKEDINPRQIGLVFSIDSTCNTLSWDRKGQWTVYPHDHIGRTSGWSKPFPSGKYRPQPFATEPENPWSLDQTSMGTNDFRATRENVRWAELTDITGRGIRIVESGPTAVRTWVDDNQIRFLVASFFTGGGDLFFSAHHEKERRPLRIGERFTGSVVLTGL
jgi:beta-galactosidase